MWLTKFLRGKRITIRLSWFGEKGLKKPMPKDKKDTVKQIMKEIRRED